MPETANPGTAMPGPEQKFDYSKAIKELDALVQKVEDPETSLDEIGSLVKRSKELIEACRNYLRSVRE